MHVAYLSVFRSTSRTYIRHTGNTLLVRVTRPPGLLYRKPLSLSMQSKVLAAIAALLPLVALEAIALPAPGSKNRANVGEVERRAEDVSAGALDTAYWRREEDVSAGALDTAYWRRDEDVSAGALDTAYWRRTEAAEVIAA